MTIGIVLGRIGIIALLIEIGFLTYKPISYKNLKIKYDTIKETMTNSSDVRDAAYTNKIIEVNETIRGCRTYINSKWVGIFYNKKICDMKLLDKE